MVPTGNLIMRRLISALRGDDMRLDIHIHDESHTINLLETLTRKVDRILDKLGVMMAKVDDLKAELVLANETTNEIAKDIDDLVSRTQGGLSESEATEVQTQLTALKDKLLNVAAVHTPGSPV